MKNINKEDLMIAKYKERFKSSRTNRFRRIGILKISFFELDYSTDMNYYIKDKLCYLKHIESNLEENFTKYEVREVLG